MTNNIEQAAKNRASIAAIKVLYDNGEITREEAKKLAQPVLDRINASTVRLTRELNKKYNLKQKPAPLDFVSIMRNSY